MEKRYKIILGISIFIFLLALVLFVIPFPYSDTEVYTEEEPYNEIETYFDSVKTVSNEPYSEDARFTLEPVSSERSFGPWGCGKTNVYLMTNLENESLCFDYITTLYVFDLKICEADTSRICLMPNEARELKLSLAYGYCSNSRMGCDDIDGEENYNVKPQFIAIPIVVKYKTIELEDEIEKNRTVVKYRTVEKTRSVTEYATLFKQFLTD